MRGSDHPSEDAMSWELPESASRVDGGGALGAPRYGGDRGAGARNPVLVAAVARHRPGPGRRRTVYVFDHLGYGRSDQAEGQDLTLAAQARRFAGLLQHWGLDTAAGPSVVANDIGGAVVLRAQLIEGARYRDLTCSTPSAAGSGNGDCSTDALTPEVFERCPATPTRRWSPPTCATPPTPGAAPGGPGGLPRAVARPRGPGRLLPAVPAAHPGRHRPTRRCSANHDPGAPAVGSRRPDPAPGVRPLAARAHPPLRAALDRRGRAPPAGRRPRPAHRPPARRPRGAGHRTMTAASGANPVSPREMDVVTIDHFGGPEVAAIRPPRGARSRSRGGAHQGRVRRRRGMGP